MGLHISFIDAGRLFRLLCFVFLVWPAFLKRFSCESTAMEWSAAQKSDEQQNRETSDKSNTKLNIEKASVADSSSSNTLTYNIEEMLLRLEQLEKSQKSYGEKQAHQMAIQTERTRQFDTMLDSERSLLEAFGEAAKNWLMERLTQSTDHECQWSWKQARCEPRCVCAFHLKFGDYSPSRACRRVTDETHTLCDPDLGLSGWQKAQTAAARISVATVMNLRAAALALARISKQTAHRVGRTLDEKSPSTDSHCAFRLSTLSCEPDDGCSFQYRLGDFSPSRSCRRRQDTDEKNGVNTFNNKERSHDESNDVPERPPDPSHVVDDTGSSYHDEVASA